MDLRLPTSGGKGSASSACSSSPAAALSTMTSSLTLEAASAPVAPVPVASAPVASAQVASASEAFDLLDSNSFLSMAINYAVKDLGYSKGINTDLFLQDPFRPPAVTTSGSIPNMGTSNPMGLSGSNPGLTPLQYTAVLPGSRYQIQVNPDGSHQVVHVQQPPNAGRTSHERKCNRTHKRVATKRLGDIEQYELIKDVSTKDMIVSDGNDTETSSSSTSSINDENEVKNQFS